jgi:glyoxylase-like metal-dependent hydrolase (beta-lactamase superfamily II)
MTRATPTPPYRVVAVRYGERETKLSEIYYGWSYYNEADAAVRMTYYFWILQPADGNPIVVDSGYSPALSAEKDRPFLCTPADALERLGIDGSDVEHVVVTHLHYDHIGNLDLFPNAEFVVAQSELDFWSSPVAQRPHFAHHADFDGTAFLTRAASEGRVRAVIDELEVAPGIRCVRVGGHSPGQLIVSIDAVGGEVLLASDAAHYYDELERDRPFAVVYDLADFYRAFDTIRGLTAEGQTFVPAHDPLVMERYPRVDGAEFAVQIA